jgi:phosphoribosylformylglycinamidine cyclo-ligase
VAVDYRQSGVDIDAGNEAVRRIKALARQTYTGAVLSGVGSFGGLYSLEGASDAVLVASADGVGTKLKIAFLMGVHNTIGADLVNHCVNDILVQGARPLFFLDYLATGQLSPAVAEQIVSGIAGACRENGCALLGGETAEMPGFYADGEYDVAGFIVGLVARSQVIDGRSIRPGDVLIGLPSSGLHTNGYSLARRVAFEHLGLTTASFVAELGESVGEAFLRTHRSYLPAIGPLLESGWIKGMAHITGGGIVENLPRVLPDGLTFRLDRDSWSVPPIFAWLQRHGGIADDEMFRAFNMGVGLIVVADPGNADGLIERLRERGESAWRIGTVIPRHHVST